MFKIIFLGLTAVAGTVFILTSNARVDAIQQSSPANKESSAEFNEPIKNEPPAPEVKKTLVQIPVPFMWEIPDGVWVPPWSGACEEASISMVDQFYRGRKTRTFSKAEAKKLMSPIFALENKLFGYNLDTSAAETAKIINEYFSFDATIKKNPALAEIKSELDAGRPVIGSFYGYDLKNPLHSFRRGGSSYHMMVFVGYDDLKKEFIINDSELKNGIDFRYSYDTILGALADFDHKTKKAKGETPTVLFTSPKELVKAGGSNRVYLIRNGGKYYISHPAVFKNHGWKWSWVRIASKTDLDKLEVIGVLSK